jgi:hypothetical protein
MGSDHHPPSIISMLLSSIPWVTNQPFVPGTKKQHLPNGDTITLQKDGVKILRRTDGTVVETIKDEKGELQVVKNAEGSVLMRMRVPGADRNSGGGNEVQFLEFGDGTKVEVIYIFCYHLWLSFPVQVLLFLSSYDSFCTKLNLLIHFNG